MTLSTNEELASLPTPAKKDKKAVIDEVITDALMEQFFALQPPPGIERDYHMLERAYRGLPAADFVRFVDLFVARGHQLGSKGPQGTMLEVIARHRKGGDYAATLKQHGA